MAQNRSSPARESKKKFHIEMTTLSLSFWVFGLCFLLTWVFVLGVLVGRGFLPSAVSTLTDLKNQVTRLQGLVTHGKPVNPTPPKSTDPDPNLAFYEKLSGKKEDGNKKFPPRGGKTALSRGESAQGKAGAPPKESPNAGKPEVRGKEVGALDASTASTGPMRFTVQLAALEDRGKAESTIRQLKGRGFEAYFHEVKVKGKTYYRVRCGKFKTREDAALYAKKLTDQAGMNGFVTQID